MAMVAEKLKQNILIKMNFAKVILIYYYIQLKIVYYRGKILIQKIILFYRQMIMLLFIQSIKITMKSLIVLINQIMNKLIHYLMLFIHQLKNQKIVNISLMLTKIIITQKLKNQEQITFKTNKNSIIKANKKRYIWLIFLQITRLHFIKTTSNLKRTLEGFLNLILKIKYPNLLRNLKDLIFLMI
ncbi:hypothetical protein NCER_102406 [Vairimorpha ceranae BRL01]|uniref:Transmembrane protein n=1 Tax=Vairimorpha ceranae (strain BRL01) TaxID=578460 RepID=C4VBZ1_VAIC1|nr:hypothetical protein NCER_102406 [Vairimorpha ceranae BRL01]